MSTKRNLKPETLRKKSAYDQAYAQQYVKRKVLPFNTTVEDDVRMLEWLDRKENITQYVKSLIMADMDQAGK